MADAFPYDVFLSHSSKDKAVVRAVAERLRKDGLKVWFDEWVLKAGDSIPAKIEEGLEHSRVLVLCMSAHAFGSDWAQLEAGTFRFRDPLNKERRFIPLRLDDAPIKGSLAQFLYINWLSTDAEQYAQLLRTCRPTVEDSAASKHLHFGHDEPSETDNQKIAVAKESMQIDIVIERDFDSYSEKDQKRLLKAIEQFLGVGGEIRVTHKRRGSVKLRLELAPEMAERLVWAAKAGRFLEFGVVDGTLVEKEIQTKIGDFSTEEYDYKLSVIGTHVLERPLGYGAFGSLWIATDRLRERKTVVKLIPSKMRDRAISVLQLLRKIHHRGIVPIYDGGEIEQGLWFAMPYIEGQTLAQRIREHRPSLSQTVYIIFSVSEAVAHLHSLGVIHRDLKPSHLIIDPHGNLHLIGFGLLLDVREQTEGEIVGTPGYMAPEQWAGRHLTPASDVWSIGVILYELLTGKRPFASQPFTALEREVQDRDPEPVRQLDKSIPRELELLCMRALSKSPTSRPSAAEMASELRKFTQGIGEGIVAKVRRLLGFKP